MTFERERDHMFAKRFLRNVVLAVCGIAIFVAAACGVDVDAIRGPKIEELYLVIIRDPDAQLLALEKGQIDLLSDITRPVDIERLASNEELSLSLAQGFHAFFLGFNIRKAPWDRVELRRAIWQAIPRNQLVRDIFSGYSAPLSTFLPPASPYCTEDLEASPYDLESARRTLQEAGWRYSNGFLIPPGEDLPLKPMKILSPTAQVAPTTAELAQRIAASLRELGLPMDVEPVDFSTLIARLDEHAFDSYVLAWQLSRDPDSLYAFFHSSMDVKGGYNICGIHDDELDAALEALRWAPDEEDARLAARRAQKLLSEKVPMVPIYSRYFVTALRNDWKGAVTTEIATADNVWSLLAMEPEGKMRPFYWCLPEEPRNLNPITASSAYDWQVLGLIYDTLLTADPETLEDLPWLARDWKVETVPSGDGQVTRLSFILRDDVLWQDDEPFTAKDVAATISFLKEHRVPRFWDAVSDVEAVTVKGNHEITITMKNTSYWHLHQIGGLPILPAWQLASLESWQIWQPSRMIHPQKRNFTMLVGTGPFVFSEYRQGEYVRLVRNDLFWLMSR